MNAAAYVHCMSLAFAGMRHIALEYGGSIPKHQGQCAQNALLDHLIQPMFSHSRQTDAVWGSEKPGMKTSPPVACIRHLDSGIYPATVCGSPTPKDHSSEEQ